MILCQLSIFCWKSKLITEYLLHPSDNNIADLRDIFVSQWIYHDQFIGCLYCADN